MARKDANEPLGQYASDRYLFKDDPRLDADPLGVKEVRGDGNDAFHRVNVYGRNEPDPDQIENLVGYAEDVSVTTDQSIVRNALRLSREQRRRDAQDESLADEWARRNGYKL